MIIKLCSTEKGIKLTDSNGKDLMRILSKDVKERIKKQEDSKFKQSYDDIRQQIVSHDVISFDIFDTLITRRVAEPEMVFDLVGRYALQKGIIIDDFRQERIRAQLESGLSNANLDEVYEQLALNTNISKEQAELLKSEELRCERNVIIPRKDMVELFFCALEAQKKVYLTTDMYLNRRYIVSILNSCQIAGYYDIFVSCEYRKLKLEGLIEEIKDRHPDKAILHIGDSYINDCICAEIAGVDSILIPKGTEIAEKENRISFNTSTYQTDKLVLGNLISGIYNSPFLTKQVSISKRWFNIGYAYIGPILLAAIAWMVRNIPLEKYDGILLSARDGYLFNKAFIKLKERKMISDDISIHYFYISRKAAVAMHTDEEATINMLIDSTAPYYLPDRLLEEVFCLGKGRAVPYNLDVYGDNRYKYIWDHYGEIKENVKKLRRNFYKYLGREKLIMGGRYLLYDFVSSGTVHRALSSIVPFEIDGVYYQFTGDNDFAGAIYSRFSQENQSLTKHYKEMEDLMLSIEPSLWGYKDDGSCIFCNEGRSYEQIEKLKMVHEGTLSFLDDFLESYNLNDALISDDLTLCLISKLGAMLEIIDQENEVIDDWLMGI